MFRMDTQTHFFFQTYRFIMQSDGIAIISQGRKGVSGVLDSS